MRVKQFALRKDNIGLIDNFEIFARSTAKEINDEIREITKKISQDNKKFGMKDKQKKNKKEKVNKMIKYLKVILQRKIG